MYLLSRLNATEFGTLALPPTLRNFCPLVASQIIAVRSHDAVTT
jgi:hypothetical protein